MALTISSLSREYIRVPVFAKVNGTQVRLNSVPVEFAFLPENQTPVQADWVVGSWEFDKNVSTYYARCLVGPDGDIELSPGSYDAWMRVTITPELVVRNVGGVLVV